jgi:hypothetical protein
LQGDESRAPRYGDRIRNALELIDKDDDIGRLGRRARAASAHGDADVSRRQGRSVINAVANHQGRVKPLLHCDGLDLVGRNTIREHGVEVERAAIVSAASARSPVTSIRDTPAPRSARTARGASRRSSSASSKAPIARPSTETKTLRAERQEARRSALPAHSSGRPSP